MKPGTRVCIVNVDSPNVGALGTVLEEKHWYHNGVFVLCDGEDHKIGFDRGELQPVDPSDPKGVVAIQREHEAAARAHWRKTKITRCPPGAAALPFDF